MNLQSIQRAFKERATHLLASPYFPFLVLACLTAGGATLRAYHLGFKSLWYDEALFYWIGQGDLAVAIKQNALKTSAPPLFAILISLVSRVSITELALRFVPFLAGTLAIPAMYALARRYLSVGAALSAAAMIALAPSQIKFSQQLREYSMSVLLALVILVCFSDLLKKRSWRSAILLGIATIVGIFTHYGLALLILATDCVFLIYVLVMKGPRRNLFFKWLAAQGPAIVAVLAVYSLALRQQIGPVVFGGASYLQSGFWTGSSAWSAVGFLYSGVRDLMTSAYPGYVFTLMLYTGTMVLVLLHSKTHYPYLIAAPVAVVACASLLRLYPLSGQRQDLFLTPLVILVAATAFDYMIKNDSRRLLAVLFLSLIAWRAIPSLLSYYPTDGDSSLGPIVRRLVAISAPGDPIYLCLAKDPALRYYVYARYPMPLNPIIEGANGPGPRDYLDQVDSILTEYHRAWFVIHTSCKDTSPLLDHVAKEWTVELIEKRYPDTQLFYVH